MERIKFMQPINFEFLRPHWEDLANLGAHAEEYAFSYPMYYLNQRVAKIGFDNKLTTITYLKFYFGLDRIKTELTKNNRGVRQANISNTDI